MVGEVRCSVRKCKQKNNGVGPWKSLGQTVPSALQFPKHREMRKSGSKATLRVLIRFRCFSALNSLSQSLQYSAAL